MREVAKDVPETVENKSEWIEERIATIMRFKTEATWYYQFSTSLNRIPR